MLTPEYEAAVRLGVITEKQAEAALMKAGITMIDRNDSYQRKAFFAGYLWMNFKLEWDVTGKDLETADVMWNEWCDHIERKQIND